MENISTSSESQLKNTGLLQDLSNHKGTKVTNLSLINSTLEVSKPVNAKDSSVNTGQKSNKSQKQAPNTQYSDKGISPDNIANSSRCHQTPILNDTSGIISCKEEKQRQNEEIVILESSSLSSETGSWESVFPSKYTEKGIKKNVFKDQEFLNEIDTSKDLPLDETPGISTGEDLCPSLVQKSPFKSTSCFIDAASLLDEGDNTVKISTDDSVCPHTLMIDDIPGARKPVPPSTEKSDVSPNDWSESNENEDSLEQPDEKDPNFGTNDLSPTMFEMTPLTEDSLSTNAFEIATHINKDVTCCDYTSNLSCSSGKSALTCALIISDTPNNSMVSDLNHYDSENSELKSHLLKRDNCPNMKKNVTKYHEFSPIVSGGASIEDHLPQTSHSGSPMTRRKNENMPIISGAYVAKINTEVIKKHHKPISESMWVVDMSTDTSLGAENSSRNSSSPSTKKTENSDDLKSFSKLSLDSCYETFTKSRSSVDSDCSEKSSQKFYIDLSNIPDPVPVEMDSDCKSLNEKKNMFSMYIDLGEQSNLKEMPARLLSSKQTRKSAIDSKPTSKPLKSISKDFTLSNTSPFEKYESLCNDPNISIRDIIRISDSDASPKSKEHAVKKENMLTILNKNKSKANTVVVSNNVTKSRNNPTDAFVKLSDLDKPQKVDTSLVIHEEKVLDVRMTRSIPENKWNQSNTMPSRTIISSFHSENTLSLNRLFPHLKNEFSRSSPGLISNHTKSPIRAGITSSPGDEDQHSEVSEISSVHSSVCHSIVEHSTTEETSQASSLLVNCQSRLGQDLLRMFLEEIAPDVIVEVSGRRIKAHKCILSSRCQYFAGILSGGWVESAGNVIVLPPFSFSVVHFALCHIYSGVSTIPDSISIVELATIADMLGLEGLKEAIMFTLKAKYCHHFHQPCPVCIAGVLECFPLSSVYGLDDLYRKCLKWITKYFSKVWPTKAFATLPKELLDKCYQQHIVNMSIANLLDTIYGCGITVASLQNSRWAESVARMCHRLVNAAAQYAAPRLVTVLHALNKLPPQTPAHAKQALEDCISVAIEWAPPDETCRAYAFLSFLIKDMRNNQRSKPDLISSSNQTKGPGNNILYTDAVSWLMQCESALVRAAPRVVGTQAFKDLPSDLKKKLRELGCIMYRAQNTTVSPSFPLERNSRSTIVTKSNKNMKNQCTSRSLDIDHVRASFVPYAPKPKLVAAPVDAGTSLKVKPNIREKTIKDSNSPKIRTTKAQEERARFNLSKSIQLQENSNKKKNSVRSSSDNGKIEPKTLKSGKKIGNDKKLSLKMISSSESSRNSSPIQSKNLRTSGITSRQNMKVRASTAPQDILVTPSRPRTAEPSSESLNQLQSNPKYATYVKTKHSIKGSIESVNSSKNFNNAAVAKKIRTKIPIYLNHGIKSSNNVSKKDEESENRYFNRTTNAQTNNLQIRNRNVERKVPGSLMNATKSSSAKMVLKRDALINKSNVKNSTRPASHANDTIDPVKIREIPVMERSDTFLKDEPTFGDKMTNLDIDQ